MNAASQHDARAVRHGSSAGRLRTVFGPFRFDPEAGLLTRNGAVVPLRRKSWQVLSFLIANAGRVVSKDELLRVVWNDRIVSDTTVSVTIAELRRALGAPLDGDSFIQTLYGRGYRFIGNAESDSASESGDARASSTGEETAAPRLVGRESELALARTFLADRQAASRVLLFAGEPGIGKSTLLEAIVAEMRARAAVGLGQCPPNLGAGYPYFPVLAALHEISVADKGARLRLQELAPNWFARLPGSPLNVVSLPSPPITGELDPAEIFAFLEESAPVVLAFEDLHWADHATLDLISLLAEHPGLGRCCVLGTYRPADAIAERRPILRTRRELLRRERAREILLEGLPATSVGEMIARRLGVALCPDRIAAELHEQSGGNPLYVHNLVDHLVASSALIRTEDGVLEATGEFASASREIPETLRELISLRLTETDDDTYALLGAMSVVGLQASAAEVATVLNATIGATDAACAKLARSAMFLQRNGETLSGDGTVSGTYEFRHPLYQRVAYDELAPAVRIEAHRRMARWLTRHDDGKRDGAIAQHFDRGQQRDEAIAFYLRAAEVATQQHATSDAIEYLHRALELHEGSSDTEREQLILTRLGIALGSTRGFTEPEFAALFARARRLHARKDDMERGIESLAGLAAANLMTGAPRAAEDFTTELLEIGFKRRHAMAVHGGELLLAAIRYHQGDLAGVFESIGDTPSSSSGTHKYGPIDLGLARSALRSIVLWQAGRPDAALEQARILTRLAESDGHPINRIVALQVQPALDFWRGDSATALAGADALMASAAEIGFGQVLALAYAIKAAATHELGSDDDPVALIEAGRAASAEHGEMLTRLISDLLGVEVLAARGHLARAEEILAELRRSLRNGEARFWEPELERWQGEMLLLTGGRQAHDKAASRFLRARELAAQQGSQALVLRAATSLARLYRNTGRKRAGRQELQHALAGIVGGADTRDVKAARALLGKAP